MAVDRSIRVTIYNSLDDEVQSTLIRRLMAHGEPVGTCVTSFGAYVAGTRVNNLLLAVGTGAVETSVRYDIDAAVSIANFLTLLARVCNSTMAAGTVATMTTGTYAVGAGSTDSVTMTIT